MEQNLSVITKKVWKMMKLALLMLRKGICKKKMVLDLNLMMKRAKITTKAAAMATVVWPTDHPQEYEFSCKSTPLYRHYFNNNKAKNNSDHRHYISSPNFKNQFEYEAVNKVLDSMLSSKHTVKKQRQLSITDSPFQLQSENQHVDAAADDFIKRFYSQLMQQDC